MMNPAAMMKMMGAARKFEGTHPKFVAFLKTMMSSGIDEGTIIEITVTKPDGTQVTGNMKVQASDMELFQELKNMNMN